MDLRKTRNTPEKPNYWRKIMMGPHDSSGGESESDYEASLNIACCKNTTASFFCEDCKKICCINCLEAHRSHNFKRLTMHHVNRWLRRAADNLDKEIREATEKRSALTSVL